jgi:polysaccharide export outer membrane protein
VIHRLCTGMFLIITCVSCQTPPPSPETWQNLPSQRAGVDDLVNIAVYGSPELSRPVRIGKDGTIRVPMLESPIKAAGLMPSELEQAVAGALKSENILVDPVVTVWISEYRSRPVTVMGAVNRPIKFQADGEVTLLDAISRAQGLAPNAGPEILVTAANTSHSSDTAPLTRRVAVRELIGTSDPAMNLTLHGGEEIRVPEMGKVFVIGNVKKPGLFPVQDESGTTVLKVLAYSEGLAPYASKTCYIYRKNDKTGTSTEIPLDIHAVLARKSADVPLEANDILYVPDNSGRRIALGTLEKLLVLGSASSAALVYNAAR